MKQNKNEIVKLLPLSESVPIHLKQTKIVNLLCYFSGGFAFVFVAQDNTSGKEYALKVCVLR